ncbi:MAG: ABC transporter ATP-binding protein [Candidatus Saccharibacteria bacterium]|nr:ABC transporter ATP-binding protein [Candidatus Saccharibacteria bacterium]
MKNVFRILATARELWRYYLVISIFTIGLSLLTLLQPFLSGLAIDEVSKGTDASIRFVAMVAVVIFLLDLAQTLFGNISGYIGDQMAAKLNRILSWRYYQHLLTLPQQYFDTELSGKIINRLNRSINQITNFVQMLSNNFLQFIFTTVFSLIAVALYSWQVALMLFTLYPIYIFLTFRSSSKWQRYQVKKNRHLDIASGRFAEAVSQIKVVKSFISEKRELGFFSKHFRTMIATNKPQSKFWHTRDVQRRIILNVIFLFVYMFIFVRAAQGVFSPGQAVALILYAMQIRIPIFTISFLVENTQRAIADSKDYFEIMNVEPDIQDIAGASALRVHKGEIVFSDVSFGYDKKPVLKDINLTIKPDTKVALVGESGEGKTTLTNILLRLYEPQKGSIEIDNQDICRVTQKSLRQNIGVVFQDPSLFSGTIRENITYGNPKASLEDVKAAARAANAHEFIEKLDKQYNAEIGEHGLKLSGGQKQRIAIARALLKDAPILILDEATSSLDSRSEQMVQEALERLMKGRTTIIIAHRLSTISHVDQIITFKGGMIDEIGSPSELSKSGGIYEQLLTYQQGKTDTSKKKLKKYEITT